MTPMSVGRTPERRAAGGRARARPPPHPGCCASRRPPPPPPRRRSRPCRAAPARPAPPPPPHPHPAKLWGILGFMVGFGDTEQHRQQDVREHSGGLARGAMQGATLACHLLRAAARSCQAASACPAPLPVARPHLATVHETLLNMVTNQQECASADAA